MPFTENIFDDMKSLMKPQYFLNKDGSIKSAMIKAHLDYIESNFGQDISYLMPKAAQRIKYDLFHDGSDHSCVCGKPRALSDKKGEVFKSSCGSMKCVAVVRDNESKRKNFDKAIKARQATKDFDMDTIRSYLIEKLKTVKPELITSYVSEPEIRWINKAARDQNIRPIQLCYNIIHGIEDMRCEHGTLLPFVSWEVGYSKSSHCCGKANRQREENKIAELVDAIPDGLELIEGPPINQGTWAFRCRICAHDFDLFVKNGRGTRNVKCPRCYPRTKSSYEYDLISDLRSVYDGEIIHTHAVAGKTIDIYIPDKKLGIEINGMYWHSDDRNRHLDKMKLCQEHGISLIQFTDADMIERYPIVLSMIKNRLGLNERKIAGRKCLITEISTKDYRNFCDDNHIKGYAPARTKFGMFYGEELVSVFSISKSRFSDEVELIRFCTLKNTTVHGALGKFIKHHGADFMTYADLHYGTGDAYEKIGMQYVGTTPPNYVYHKGTKVYSRLKFQKHKLKNLLPEYDPDLTEKENMLKAGYRRYYDCGNKKFLWRQNENRS